MGNKYIELLENTINLKEKEEKEKEKENIIYNNRNKNKYEDEDENDENNNEKERNLENKYHNMLDKSFEVLNSVSNKCDDNKGKVKGGVDYYVNKDPDYDELIEAQKRWLDNLPEKNYIIKKDVFNYNNNSTFSNTYGTNSKERFNEDINEDNYIYNLNVKDNYNENFYQNMSDFNKNRENKYNKNNLVNSYNLDKNNINNFNNYDFHKNLEDNQKITLNENIKNYNKNKIFDYKNKFNNYFDFNNDNIGYDAQLNKNKNNSINDYKNKYNINNINKDNNDYIKSKYDSYGIGYNNDFNKNNDYYNDYINPNKKNNFNYIEYKSNRYNLPKYNTNFINNNLIDKLNIDEKPNLNNIYTIKDNKKKEMNNLNNIKDIPFYNNYIINDSGNNKKPSLNANDIKISNNNSKLNEDINRNISFNKNKNPLNNNNYINNKNNQNKNDSFNSPGNNIGEGNKFEKERNSQEQAQEEEQINGNNILDKNQLINYPNQNINKNNINNQKKNNNYNQNQENKETSPLNERYIIIDKNGNPIFVGGIKLLGMELIPWIGEDGKEVLDDNGNIILIDPEGKPRTQDELEPILLDDDKPLVNDENRPFLGLDEVPLINGLGNPVLGPGELYDRNNKVVKGFLGYVAKDNNGNPIKVFLNENDSNNGKNKNNKNDNDEEEEDNNNVINNNLNDINNMNNDYNKNLNNNSGDMNTNNINNNPNANFGDMNINNDNHNDDAEDENENNDGKDNNNLDNNKYNNNLDKNYYDYNNLRPLIGPNGKPVKDVDNNYILLDEYNRPVKNTGISLLLDQTGKPVLNSKSKPILIDLEGRPINLEDNNNNANIPNLNSLINPDILYPSQQDQMPIINKKQQKKKPETQQPFYQKMNDFPNYPYDKNDKNKGYINLNKKPEKFNVKKEKKPKYYNDYNNLFNSNRIKPKLNRERTNIRDKTNKGILNYSQCSPDSIRKIHFFGYNEYKGACFACDVGCSVSRSGYSPMNYSPYNNLIRRREITPLKNRKNVYEGHYNIQVNKKDFENDNNYYLTEA